jgi:hypothetical protein
MDRRGAVSAKIDVHGLPKRSRFWVRPCQVPVAWVPWRSRSERGRGHSGVTEHAQKDKL